MSGRPQVVEALREVLVRKALHTLEFDDEGVLDQDIGEVFSDALVFVGDRK